MRIYLLLFLMLAVPLALSGAQPMQEPGQRPFERVEQWKKVRMIEMLDLTEDQSIRFFSRLNEHEKGKQKLGMRMEETLDRIERLVRNRGDGPDYMKAFAETSEIREQIAELDRQFFEGLDDLLSVEQRAKFLLFQRHFQRQLRDAMKQLHRRHDAMRGPDAP